MGVPELETAISNLNAAITAAQARVAALAVAPDLTPQVNEVNAATTAVEAIAPVTPAP